VVELLVRGRGSKNSDDDDDDDDNNNNNNNNNNHIELLAEARFEVRTDIDHSQNRVVDRD
jgi:hypothetical protein